MAHSVEMCDLPQLHRDAIYYEDCVGIGKFLVCKPGKIVNSPIHLSRVYLIPRVSRSLSPTMTMA